MKKAKSRLKPKAYEWKRYDFVDVRSLERKNEKIRLFLAALVGAALGFSLGLYLANLELRNRLGNRPEVNQCIERMCAGHDEVSDNSTHSRKETFRLRAKTEALIEKYPDFVAILTSRYGAEWQKWAELLARESSFDQYAVNPSSGACGWWQALLDLLSKLKEFDEKD